MRLRGISHAVNPSVKRLFYLALVAAAFLAPVHSATLERLSLDNLIGKSTRIVRGSVADSWAALTGTVIYTHYKIQVTDTYKGAVSSSVEVMVPGGTVGTQRQSFSGAPLLNRGDEFVFFLWTSSRGITWITGLTQGLFTLSPPDASTDRMASRAASRELMLDPATSQSVKDSAISLKLSDLRARIAASVAAQGGVK